MLKLLTALVKHGGAGVSTVFYIVALFALVPIVAGQYGFRDTQPVPVETVNDWDSPLARATANLIAELHAGSAPRDADHVPFWHRALKAVEKNTAALNRNTAELEDRTHRRPPREITRQPLPEPEPGLWARFLNWLAS